jgi:hypothetical protein
MDLTRSLKTCARTRCAAAEGADVMATQSRGGVHRSERFQIHCLKSAVRLERRDKGGHEGLRAIDTAATVSAGVRRHPRCKFRRSWLLREIRASVSLPRSSISALIRLGLGSELSRDRFAPVPYRPVTAVVLWRAGEDWEAAVDSRLMPCSSSPARSKYRLAMNVSCASCLRSEHARDKARHLCACAR